MIDNIASGEKESTEKSLVKGRVFYIALLLIFFALSIWQIAEFTETSSLNKLKKSGELRAYLYATSLRDTLEKYRHLPYVLARDPRIVAMLLDDIPSIRISPHLEDFAREAGVLIYVLDRGGTTVAASNWRNRQSLLGHNFSFRPYFLDAKVGLSGGYYAVGLLTRQPGFFISYPVHNEGEFIGAIVVKVNLESMQETWKKSEETVIVSDVYGIIFLTSNPKWKYFSLRPLSNKTINKLRAVQYLDLSLQALEMNRKSLKGHNILALEGNLFLEQPLQLPEYGWRLHYLTNLSKVKDDVSLSVSISTIFGFLFFLTLLYLRERRQKLLSMQKASRAAAIKEINERLLKEIEEHKQTTENLQNTQKELIQAGKLAALGRMSAAIAHELNQPVTAIRTFIASCKILLERQQTDKVSENLDFIGKLTERMGKITGQLKTFARKSKGKEEAVDLVTICLRLISMMKPQIDKSGVSLTTRFPADTSIRVSGDSLQVEQVMSNLLHNALDAMKASAEKKLFIEITADAGKVVLTLIDSGPGIEEEALDNLFDPFFTTKDIGEGLGLGLSISYGIIQDMQGNIRADNLTEGGARFTVELPIFNTQTLND